MERSYDRYQRQIALPEIGEKGQRKLLQAKVLVVGAGGLGCPVLQYLAAAGVGTIGIIDDDVVALSNLHRQVLYQMGNIGMSKATCAASRLQQLNPEIQIRSYAIRLTNQNALEIIAAYEIIVDGTDNFPTRYMINDACVLLDKPLVYGAVSRFEGQVAVFNGRNESNGRTTNYRDLFPVPPAADEVLNCAEGGVIGVLPGLIGTMQAAEVIKLITGIGQPLINRLITYNVLSNQLFEMAIAPSETAADLIPKDETAFLNMDYDWTCAALNVAEINSSDFEKLVHDPSVVIIDVRERDEVPLITGFPHLKIPLSQLQQAVPAIEGQTIIVFCQSGKRSQQAANLLLQTFGASKKIYSLKGGISACNKIPQQQNT